MIAESIVGEMLKTSEMTALLGEKIFLTRAAPNSKPPYLVYEVVEDVSRPNLNVNEPIRHDANIRIFALDLKAQTISQINAAVKSAMNFKFQINVNGKKVIESRLRSMSPMEKDPETGILIQATDCILRYYE